MQENERAYKAELKQEFSSIIDDIHSQKISAESAKNKISSLRNKYQISYTDEAGIIDSIIDRTAETDFSVEEAEFYFTHLQNGTLMAYRKEKHINDVISLLQSSLQNGNSDKLLSILDNYYEFTGLEKDDNYSRIHTIITAPSVDAHSIWEIKSGLDSIKSENSQHISSENTSGGGAGSSGSGTGGSVSAGRPQTTGTGTNQSGPPQQTAGTSEPGDNSQSASNPNNSPGNGTNTKR